MNDATYKACGEITKSILVLQKPDKKRVRKEIQRICSEYALERMPKNHEILSVVNSKNEFERLRHILLKKPAKTASGVAVVALMPKPFACPHGRCTYCPGGIQYNSPNSYTGSEPATIGAIQVGYDPNSQITDKIKKLEGLGHEISKMEVVIVGGTFLFMPADYQEWFIKSCYDALNGYTSKNLEEAKLFNEHTNIRNVGLTIETKPDYCKETHIDMMLKYGATRVEIGVQSLQERVYRKVNRGHTYTDVIESFGLAKDAGYKIVAHMMPGLPTMTPDEDINDFERLFADSALRPDMLKIYPSLVIRDTPMYDEYVRGEYIPYSDEQMTRVLVEAKAKIPKWVRIMRVQREIHPSKIVAGPRSGNLRQLVQKELARRGMKCSCIRCREPIRNQLKVSTDHLKLDSVKYDSSGGHEVFLSYEDDAGRIYGFLRLRHPSDKAHRPEVFENNVCIVRELHVYGKSVGIGKKGIDASTTTVNVQHLGLGKQLLEHAEKIAKEEFDASLLLVISAIGTREYYRKQGYSLYDPYMAKELK